MANKKIGNDFNIVIGVSKDGTPVSLLNAQSIHVTLIHMYYPYIRMNIVSTIKTDALLCKIPASLQTELGKYRLFLSYIIGTKRYAVDECDVFQLVTTSWTGEVDNNDITVNMDAKIETEASAEPSAYEIAVLMDGFTGTYQDWLDGSTGSGSGGTGGTGGNIDLSNYYTKEEVNKELKNKVTVEKDKVLSSNDYSNEDKKEVSKIKNKVDSETGKGLSSNDYTNEEKEKLSGLNNYNDAPLKERMVKLENDFANVTGAVISTSEQKVSIFRYGSKDYDVYELTVELSNLPVVAGESVNILVSEQPCGNNLYLKADCLSIATGTGDKSIFPVSAYTVKKVYVDDNLNTVATIMCNEAVASVTKAILTIRYVKGILTFDNLELKIPISELGITSADEVSIELPELKYNKKMCYQFSMDDGLTGVYYVHWKHIRRNKLCFTNGCGIDKLFAPAHAWLTYNAYMIDLHNGTEETVKSCPWIFANKMIDFGSSIYNHGGGRYGATFIEHPETAYIYANAKKSYDDNIQAIQNNAKIFPFVTVTPGGDTAYMQPYDEVEEKDTDQIYAYTSKSGTSNLETITRIVSLLESNNSRLIFSRRNLDTFHDSDDLQGIVSKIEEAYNANDRFIYSDFAHGPASTSPESNQQTAREHMTWLYENYGKAGSDTIWFCPMDEFYEYQTGRLLSKVKTSVKDGLLIINIKYPKLPHFRFFDSSLLIKRSTGNIGEVTAISCSENIAGLSYKNQSDGSFMVCFNWNNGDRALTKLSEKYTSLFETSQSNETKWDAIYFINQLKPDLQAPFLERLSAGEVAPVLNSVLINSGEASTYDKAVNIVLNLTGVITHYRISEQSNLSDNPEWIVGTGNGIDFTLSDGYGLKSVYVQVKNQFGESEIKADSINYIERPAITYTVTGKSNNTSYGTVTPSSQTVADGGNATVNAQAKDNCVIESWSGADSSTGVGAMTGTATVTNIKANKTITCNFKQNSIIPPSDKNKWILSFGHSYMAQTWDSATGIDRQMGITAAKDIYTSTGKKLGSVKINNYGVMTTNASLTKNTDRHGAITGDNSGLYPDEYLAMIVYAYQIATGETYPKMAFGLSSLPNGNYRIKLLSSTIKASLTGDGELCYIANGVEIRKPNTFPLNNLTEFVVFDNVTVSDGTISIITTTTNGGCNPISIVEIEEL